MSVTYEYAGSYYGANYDGAALDQPQGLLQPPCLLLLHRLNLLFILLHLGVVALAILGAHGGGRRLRWWGAPAAKGYNPRCLCNMVLWHIMRSDFNECFFRKLLYFLSYLSRRLVFLL